MRKRERRQRKKRVWLEKPLIAPGTTTSTVTTTMLLTATAIATSTIILLLPLLNVGLSWLPHSSGSGLLLLCLSSCPFASAVWRAERLRAQERRHRLA